MNVRRPTMDDLAVALEIAQAADVAVIGESDWTEADMRDEWVDLDLSRDAWLVELDGRAAGFATFENSRGRLRADGYVHPELRGRGVGAKLLELTEARALDEPVTDGARAIHNATLNGDAQTKALYEASGYRPVRHFWRMVADLEHEPETAPPDGIEIRPYSHPDDARAVHAALEEAFLDHWDYRPTPYEQFAKDAFDERWFDPSLWRVAVDGDEVVGAAVNQWKRWGDWGWVDDLGVRAAWRRRGIAGALLRASFAEFFRRGERRVALGVDAQSETGATRLYERAGMHVFWEAVVWEKTLDG